MKSKPTSTRFRLLSILLSLTIVGTANPASAKDANELAPTSTATSQLKVDGGEMVNPQDPAYQTLKNLSAKYGCETTLKGDRALTRDEFASNLNTCAEAMEQTIALDLDRRKKKIRKPAIKRRKPRVVAPAPAPEPMPETPPTTPEPETPAAPPAPVVPEVSQQDLEQLRQLVQSFSTELKAYDTKIQAVEAKTAALKDQSFSNTTKLVGEAIFAVTGLTGGANPANPGGTAAPASGNTIFGNRLRLNFRTSFTGKDLLLTRLQSRNNNSFAGAAGSGTNMTRLGFEGSDENATTLHRLQYQLPVSNETKVFVEAVGSEFNDNVYTFNPEHQSAGLGSVTRFGRFNPIYRLSGEGAGFTLDHKFGPGVGVVVGYAVPRVNNLEVANQTATGLFGGSNVAFSQLQVKPSDGFNLGLIYARSYHTNGSGVQGNNGSSIANNPFNGASTTANHYSVLASLDLAPDIVLSGWGGLSQANRETGGVGSADLWNYAGTLAFKNVGGKGSTLGFVVGMPPKLTSNSGATAARVDPATSLHLEAFYKYKLSDNLFITPGILMLTNPEHNSNNPTEYLGTIRTTFNF
jgi:Carbohydrate-selective porin, OprB family